MAKAIQHRKISITLELDEDEAQTLRDVCDMIGGIPDLSRRRFMQSIGDALDSAGVVNSEKEDVSPAHSSIYFTV
jgi:hypothetical protein